MISNTLSTRHIGLSEHREKKKSISVKRQLVNNTAVLACCRPCISSLLILVESEAMLNSSHNETSNWSTSGLDYELDRSLRFWLFLVFDVFAIVCTVFVLYHLLTKRELRQALHNHVLIILLVLIFVYQVVDIPLHLQFLSTGSIRPASPALCLIWWFIDWGFYYAITVLLVFASIERHILIFHHRLVATKRKRLLFHYLPLISVILILLIFYTVAIFAPVCENVFDYTADLCGTSACYSSIPFFVMIEQLIFSGLSSLLIAIFSIALLIRVVRQKHRMHQIIQWHKQRKLAIQTISLSLLYLILSFPNTITFLVRLYIQANWADSVLPLFFFLAYFPIMLLPYVCLANLPNFGINEMKIGLRRRHRVEATTQR